MLIRYFYLNNSQKDGHRKSNIRRGFQKTDGERKGGKILYWKEL